MYCRPGVGDTSANGRTSDGTDEQPNFLKEQGGNVPVIVQCHEQSFNG